ISEMGTLETITALSDTQRASMLEDALRTAELKKAKLEEEEESEIVESAEDSINRIARPPKHMQPVSQASQPSRLLHQQPSTSKGTHLGSRGIGQKQVRVCMTKVPMSSARTLQTAMRPRGTEHNIEARHSFNAYEKCFEKCEACARSLAGCITPGAADGQPDAIIFTCGHVVCNSCKLKSMVEQKLTTADRVPHKCLICREAVVPIILPSREKVNQATCHAPYCLGEEFAEPRRRCLTCQMRLCETCVPLHDIRYPGKKHQMQIDPKITVNPSRPFTFCHRHQRPVEARCSCGEMVCVQCENNFETKKGDYPVDKHYKIPMMEVDIALEDEMLDVATTIEQFKEMRKAVEYRRDRIMETVDRTNNEIALHFNQIILQAIQRCFDVMTAVKQSAVPQYNSTNELLKEINTAERKIVMGTMIDERSRESHNIASESVAAYARQAAYALCKAPLKEISKLEDRAFAYENEVIDITLPSIDTTSILESIGQWCEKICYDFGNEQELVLDKTAPLPVLSIVGGSAIHDMALTGNIEGSRIPLRLHTALDHFTDLHEQRFGGPEYTGNRIFAKKRFLPFQLGMRVPPDATFTSQQANDRQAYERMVVSRLGLMNVGPKIFGGYKKIFNLTNTTTKLPEIYARTPNLAPIWGVDEYAQAAKEKDTFMMHRKSAASVARFKAVKTAAAGPTIMRKDVVVTGSVRLTESDQSGNGILNRKSTLFTNSIPNGIQTSSSTLPANGDATKKEIKEEIPDEEDDSVKVTNQKLRNPAIPPPKPLIVQKEEELDDYEDDTDMDLAGPSTSTAHLANHNQLLPTTNYVARAPFVQFTPYTINQQSAFRRRGPPAILSHSSSLPHQSHDAHSYAKNAGKGTLNVHHTVPAIKVPSVFKAKITETNVPLNSQSSSTGFPVLFKPNARKTWEWPPRKPENYVDLVRRIDQIARPSRGTMGVGEDTMWNNLTDDERDRLRAAAMTRAYNPKKNDTIGCFVCDLFREKEGRDPTWQCNGCVYVGRPITPVMKRQYDGPSSSKKARIEMGDKMETRGIARAEAERLKEIARAKRRTG
ncbi:hypothetical protein PFISCL1PPCAC_26546, partial [Pristionchus fissidentatus]